MFGDPQRATIFIRGDYRQRRLEKRPHRMALTDRRNGIIVPPDASQQRCRYQKGRNNLKANSIDGLTSSRALIRRGPYLFKYVRDVKYAEDTAKFRLVLYR